MDEKMSERIGKPEIQKQNTNGLEYENSQCTQPTKQEDKATGKELESKLIEQGYCCAACGVPLAPKTATLDHIIPCTFGGGHSIDNLQWLCRPCNRLKGTQLMHEFVEHCSRIHMYSVGSLEKPS